MIYTMKAEKTVQAATLKRTNMYFTAPQLESLAKMSAKTGLSIAELVRRAVDRYLKAEDKEKK